MKETIVDRLYAHAISNPSGIAIRFLDDQAQSLSVVTWKMLWAQANLVAEDLYARGLSGSRIAILLPTGIEFVASLFGILLAKGVAVPLKASKSAEMASRLTGMVTDADPAAVIVDDVIAERCSKSLANRHCIFPPTLDAQATLEKPTMIDGSEVAIIQYTSGSTSSPKGVEVTHNNIVHNAESICESTGVSPDSVGLSWLPLFHDMGLMGSLMSAVHRGCELNLMSPTSFIRRPLSWLKAIKTYSATHVPAPNFAFDYCCEKISDAQVAALDFTSVRVFLSGAEAVRPTTMERFTEKFGPAGMSLDKVAASYGLAEATLYVSSAGLAGFEALCVDHDFLTKKSEIRPAIEGRRNCSFVSVGVARPNTNLVIVDAETSRPVSEGRTGEIWVNGPCVAKGYFGQPEVTETTFANQLSTDDERSYLRTGDEGFIQDGRLYITGRMSDLIIVRGVNHHPEDIEASATEAHAGLLTQRCAAFQLESATDGLVIVQEIPRKLFSLSSVLLRKLSYAVAQRHGIAPTDIVLVRTGTLPLTSSGKIRRGDVRTLYEQGELTVIDSQRLGYRRKEPLKRSLSQSEMRISEIWSEVLEISDIGPDENFFEIGGSSIDLVQVHGRLTANHPELEIDRLFEHPTISSLSSFLDGQRTGDRIETAKSRGALRRKARRRRIHAN